MHLMAGLPQHARNADMGRGNNKDRHCKRARLVGRLAGFCSGDWSLLFLYEYTKAWEQTSDFSQCVWPGRCAAVFVVHDLAVHTEGDHVATAIPCGVACSPADFTIVHHCAKWVVTME